MTIAERIVETVGKLPLVKQRQALRLIRQLKSNGDQGVAPLKKRRPQPGKPAYVAKDPAVRAIAGIWKGRSDLPEDAVQAVKTIRKRMRPQGLRNA